MIQGRKFTIALVLLDITAVVLTYNFAAWSHGLIAWNEPRLVPLALPVFMHLLAIYLIDGYSRRTDMMSVTYTSLHAIALLMVMLCTLLLTYAVIPAGFQLQDSRLVTIAAFLVLIPLTLSYRRLIYQRRLARRQDRYFLFLGSPESCVAFKQDCRRNGMVQSVLYATHATFVPDIEQTAPDGITLPPFGDAAQYLKQHENHIDAIILRETNRELPASVAQKLVELHFSGVPTYTLELFHEVYWRKIPLYRLNQTWLFQEGFQIAREPVFERLKRIGDLVFATIGLLLASPLFLLVAPLIWLGDRGPVFFLQSRVGKNRVPFNIVKFRTMRPDAGGNAYTGSNDPRVTKIGRFLRATRLDEVPQLWNVLVGEMSLIGPRAEWVRLVEDYEKQIPCYHFRHLVKPGITGWAQVNYPYGANLDDTLHKLEYDLYYIRYFSFVLDASIVLKTIHIMLFGKGR
jgi:exopolysaccharide biosynthesis polyprenyl glycosylphosphotransferase